VSFGSTKVFHGEHFFHKTTVPSAFGSLSTDCGLFREPRCLSTVIHVIRRGFRARGCPAPGWGVSAPGWAGRQFSWLGRPSVLLAEPAVSLLAWRVSVLLAEPSAAAAPAAERRAWCCSDDSRGRSDDRLGSGN